MTPDRISGIKLMKPTLTLVLAATLLLAGCGGKEKEASLPANDSESATDSSPAVAATDTNVPVLAESASGAPTNRPEAPVKSGRRPARNLEAVALEKAIQLFYAQERRFPQHLEELVTKGYVKTLPENPPGGSYVYNPTNGQLLLVRD
jgi:hypothetical protein